jgi:hypothetical protein
MATKIYKKGAFIVTVDTVTGAQGEYNSQNVQIKKAANAIDKYDVMNGDERVLSVFLSAIQDENGSAYSEAAWDVFRYEQCGAVNQGEIANPYPAYTETVVDITAAQILAMGTTPIELLPAAGANKYYDVEKIILEYTNNTTAYSLVDDFLRVTYSTLGYSIDKQVITAGMDTICITDSTYSISVGNQLFSQALLPNASIELTTDNGTDPTLGDGTLRVKIYHKTVTFGA